MIAVAVVALLLGGLVVWQRRGRFLMRAADLGDPIDINSAVAEGTSQPEAGRDFTAAERERARRLRDYYAALKVKYERAAARPWLPVAPDPPAP